MIDWQFLERSDAQQLEDCVEAGLEREALLDDGDEHIDAYGDPFSGLHRAWRRPEEVPDAQVLFDPFEEQLDLPPAPVKVGDGAGGSVKLLVRKTSVLPVSGSR